MMFSAIQVCTRPGIGSQPPSCEECTNSRSPVSPVMCGPMSAVVIYSTDSGVGELVWLQRDAVVGHV